MLCRQLDQPGTQHGVLARDLGVLLDPAGGYGSYQLVRCARQQGATPHHGFHGGLSMLAHVGHRVLGTNEPPYLPRVQQLKGMAWSGRTEALRDEE